jgi:hypothetical protein
LFAAVGWLGTLKVDGQVIDSRPMARSRPLVLPWDETINVGMTPTTRCRSDLRARSAR